MNGTLEVKLRLVPASTQQNSAIGDGYILYRNQGGTNGFCCAFTNFKRSVGLSYCPQGAFKNEPAGMLRQLQGDFSEQSENSFITEGGTVVCSQNRLIVCNGKKAYPFRNDYITYRDEMTPDIRRDFFKGCCGEYKRGRNRELL